MPKTSNTLEDLEANLPEKVSGNNVYVSSLRFRCVSCKNTSLQRSKGFPESGSHFDRNEERIGFLCRVCGENRKEVWDMKEDEPIEYDQYSERLKEEV